MSSLRTLYLSYNGLSGTSCVFLVLDQCDTKRSQLRSESCAGPLPKVMPVSLEILNLSGGEFKPHKFTGGIPAEWSLMTNLKELKMANCGLDGGSWFLQIYYAEAN